MGAPDTSTNIARLGYEYGIDSRGRTCLYIAKGEDFSNCMVMGLKEMNQISSDAKSGISGR